MYLIKKTETEDFCAFSFCFKYCFLNETIDNFFLAFDQVLKNHHP